MNRHVKKFLFFFVPILAILLAWLGFETVSTNPIGWFLIVVGVLFSIGILIAFLFKGKNLWEGSDLKEPILQERDDRSFWFVTLGMILAFYLPPIEYLYLDFPVSPSPSLIHIGLGFIIMGSIVFVYARHVLRRWYSGHLSVQADQVLIQHGPYRFVRHPAYLGYLLMAVGICLGYASLIGVINIVFLLICFQYRMKVEEKILVDHFGDLYLQYAQKTKKIILLIW